MKITIETEKGDLTREVNPPQLNDEEYWGMLMLEMLQTIQESDKHEF